LEVFADDVVRDFVFFEVAFAFDEEVCLAFDEEVCLAFEEEVCLAVFVDTDLWEVDLAFALLDVLLFRARSSKGLASDETAASRKVRANAIARKRKRIRGEAMLGTIEMRFVRMGYRVWCRKVGSTRPDNHDHLFVLADLLTASIAPYCIARTSACPKPTECWTVMKPHLRRSWFVPERRYCGYSQSDKFITGPRAPMSVKVIGTLECEGVLRPRCFL
jgi:hypothetical protein